MKKYSAFIVNFFIIFVSLFFSCSSLGSVSIPGEDEVRITNITAEYFAIAKGYADLKNYSKATEYYKLAMKSKALRDSAYYEIGRCYALSKDWPNAEKVYMDLVRRDPENINLQLSLAYIKANSGNLTESIAMYKKLVDKAPNDAVILKNYISVLMADGKYELAEVQFYILKQRFPDDESIKDILAKLADNLENTEKLNNDYQLNDDKSTIDSEQSNENKQEGQMKSTVEE